ncbi:hypothetical protein ACFY3V_23500 [Streptosporangium sp. NPDC000095]|uniref:hypothetical protein n=1 Tax=Streptosporangium sp. NPDC000095 TaxID=3366184 RepID=UPI0036821983
MPRIIPSPPTEAFSSPTLDLLPRPSETMSIMWFFRFFAIGLLSGTVMVPLLHSPRGEGFEHLRLDAIMNLEIGWFLMVPTSLVVGVFWVGFFSKRTRPVPPGFVLGGITIAFGALVLSQAMATSRWLNSWPSGVGDPDGEYVMAAFAELSGVVTLLVGAVILISRGVAVRHSRKMTAPASMSR